MTLDELIKVMMNFIYERKLDTSNDSKLFQEFYDNYVHEFCKKLLEHKYPENGDTFYNVEANYVFLVSKLKINPKRQFWNFLKKLKTTLTLLMK